MKPDYDRPWIDQQGSPDKVVPEERGESVAMDRRAFLKILGISGVATLTACERQAVEHAIPYLVAPEEITLGVSTHYASTCTACPAACGMMATVREGRPIKLEGLKAHPLSRGGLCVLGQAHIRGLYDAGRLRAPIAGGSVTTWADLDARVRSGLAAAKESGRAVRVISSTLVSPTARRTVEAFLRLHSGRLVEYDAGVEHASAIMDAYERLDGDARQGGDAIAPSLAIDRADLLLVIGADLLGAGVEPVAHTAQYAARRRHRREGDAWRHVQIEGNHTLTGAAADERISATADERRLIALRLLKAVAADARGDAATMARRLTDSLPELPSHEERIRTLAEELRQKGDGALVVSGANNVAEQMAVALMNRILGAEGRSLDLRQPSNVRRGRDTDILEFVEELRRGEVGAVFVLGQNPVEELPAGDEIASLLRDLPLSVAIAERPAATNDACDLVAASHHGLECWGDALPRDDVLTLVQPAVRPLFDTRHPIGNFLHWMGSGTTDYRLHLMDSWRRNVYAEAGAAGFTSLWNGALSDGHVNADVARKAARAWARTSSAPRLGRSSSASVETGAAFAPRETDELTVELLAEIGVRDGKNAANPWVRELPDPLTRTSWVPTARIAPELAGSTGIEDGDVIEIGVGDVSVELPARILPGQHPNVVGVPIGYGVKDGDGADKERNACRLIVADGKGLRTSGLAATIGRTGARQALPLMQVHSSTEGRPIVHQVSEPGEEVHGAEHHGGGSLWQKRTHSPHWGMVIDLDACTGCAACVVACQAENNLPVVGPDNMADHRDIYWLRIDRYFQGAPDSPDVLFEPMLCAQCDNAPCETVCPVAATVHSDDGLNQQVYNRCVGTRYCANNCPYKVRRFNWFDFTPEDEIERMVLNPEVVVRARGVMEKCTFCVQRIQRARIESKSGGEAAPIETACQQSCPARAISFGDDSVAGSDVDVVKDDPRAFQVLAELGVEPSITYLARIRQRNGASHEGTGA